MFKNIDIRIVNVRRFCTICTFTVSDPTVKGDVFKDTNKNCKKEKTCFPEDFPASIGWTQG